MNLEISNNNYYGRKKGPKLSQKKKDNLNKLLPLMQFNINFKSDDNKFNSLFLEKHNETWLEIGYGMGENFLFQLKMNKFVNIIGCEPYINGVANLITNINKEDYHRVKLYTEDANILINTLPSDYLNKIFILFPDPWPKKKHHKRRLLKNSILDIFANILKKNGVIHIATDHKSYLEEIQFGFINHSRFQYKESLIRPNTIISTRYEKKAMLQGIKPKYLIIKKI